MPPTLQAKPSTSTVVAVSLHSLGLALVMTAIAAANVVADESLVNLAKARAAFESADYETARHLLIPLATDGQPEALFRLAIIYERGLGVAADPDLAEMLYNGFCPIPLPDEQANDD